MDDNTPALRIGCDPKGYQFNGKLMLISVVVLFAVCIIIVCYHTYARWVLHRGARQLRRNRHRDHQPALNSDPESQTHRGLDPSVLKSLPAFLYASAAHDPTLECAVCLSEFEENDTGRVLPKCNHCFHTDCIDMWFHSHSNCPLCRAPVLKVQSAGNPVDSVLSVSELAGTEPELDTRVRPDCSSTSLRASDGGK